MCQPPTFQRGIQASNTHLINRLKTHTHTHTPTFSSAPCLRKVHSNKPTMTPSFMQTTSFQLLYLQEEIKGHKRRRERLALLSFTLKPKHLKPKLASNI